MSTDKKKWLPYYIAIVVANFIFNFGFYALEPTLPLYVSSLGASDTQVGLVATGFFIAAVVTRIFIGLLVEKLGRKNMLRIGVIISVVFMLCYQLTASSLDATIVRILQGVGYGLVTTMFGSIAADILPPDKRGQGIGYLSMSTTGAVAFSPAVALSIVEKSGFKVMFLVAAGAMLIAALVCLFFVKVPETIPEELPPEGERIKKPPFWKSFYDPRVTLPIIILLLFGISRCSEQTFLPVLAQEQGLTKLSVFFIVKTWVCFASKILTGRLYDKHGPAASIIPGGISMFICLFLYSFTRTDTVLLIAAVFSGFALGQIIPAFQTFMMELVGRNRSLGNALFYNGLDLGSALGGFLMGSVSDRIGYMSMFRICSILMVGYIVLFAVFYMSKRKTRG